MDIHIAEVEVIALFGQFFCQFFSAHSKGSLDDQKLL
jgi:hypothetical protein